MRNSVHAVRALLSPRVMDQAARGFPVPRQTPSATRGTDDVISEAALAVRADVAALRLSANAEAIECAIDERQQLVERLRRAALQLASHALVSSSHAPPDVDTIKPHIAVMANSDARPCNVCSCCCEWRPRYSVLEAEYATLVSSHELLRGRTRQQSARLVDQEERWQKTEQRLGLTLALRSSFVELLLFVAWLLIFFASSHFLPRSFACAPRVSGPSIGARVCACASSMYR